MSNAIDKKAQTIVADARKRAAAKWGSGWSHLTADHKRAEACVLVVGYINTIDLSELSVDAHARLAVTWQRACELALQEV